MQYSWALKKCYCLLKETDEQKGEPIWQFLGGCFLQTAFGSRKRLLLSSSRTLDVLLATSFSQGIWATKSILSLKTVSTAALSAAGCTSREEQVWVPDFVKAWDQIPLGQGIAALVETKIEKNEWIQGSRVPTLRAEQQFDAVLLMRSQSSLCSNVISRCCSNCSELPAHGGSSGNG